MPEEPPSPLPARMQSLDARLLSFKASRTKATAKSAWPLFASTHPHLTPTNLAAAGWYHDPSRGEDACRCFNCGLVLNGWEAEDDPFEEHVKRGGCAWAETVCAAVVERKQNGGVIKLFVDDPAMLPTSSASIEVRRKTFKSLWPHGNKKRWIPSDKALSEAGFVHNPSDSSQDAVMCVYCEYNVEGWEAKDDPMELHRTKRPNCPFFHITLESSSSTAPRGTKKGTKARATRTARQASTAAPSIADPVESQNAGEEPEGKPAPAKRGRKARATTTASESQKVPQQPVKRGRGRGKKGAAAKETDEVTEAAESDIGESQAVSVVGDSQAEANEEAQEAAEEEADITVQPQPKRRGRPPKNASASQTSRPDVGGEEAMAEEESSSKAKRGKKADAASTTGTAKGGKGKKQSKATAAKLPRSARGQDIAMSDSEAVPEEVEAQHEDVAAPAKENVDVRLAAGVGSASEEGAEDEDQPTPQPSKKQPRARVSKKPTPTADLAASTTVSKASRSTASAKSKGAPTVQDDSDNNNTQATHQDSQPSTASGRSRKTSISIAKLSESMRGTAKSSSTKAPRKASHATDEPSADIENVPSKASRKANEKPLPPLPLVDSSTARPLSQLAYFANVPPTSPISPGPAQQDSAGPMDEVEAIKTVNKAVEAAMQASDEVDMSMTLEQLIKSEMTKRYSAMKRQGEEMIQEWETRAREARRRIEAL